MVRVGSWIAVVVLMTSACSSGATKHSRPSAQTASTTTVTAPPTTSRSTVASTTTVPLIIYQLKRGDTLTAIARRYGVSIAAIAAINHLANADHLVEGQKLRIPPVPPVRLVITPPDAQVGADFHLKLTGSKPSETVTFEIDSPGRKFTGPPHAASADAVVTAIYHSSLSDTAGTYRVIARGNQGTTARSSFRVTRAPTTPTDTTP